MKLQLPDVTLIAISSVFIPETIRALQISSENINYADIKLISHELPQNLPNNIKFEKCNKINNIDDFNSFCFYDLYKYFNTSHCLSVQYHATVLNAYVWEDSWLQYDWIGAPWKYSDNAYITKTGKHIRQGNGGFTLKSRKILELPTKYDLPMKSEQGWKNEDGQFCVYWEPLFTDLGVKYAPVEVAAKFSYENEVPENKGLKTFGFHKFKGNANE